MNEVIVESSVRWDRTETGGCSVVRLLGDVDVSTSRGISDDLVRFAMDRPRGVIVVADRRLEATGPVPTAVADAQTRVDYWPSVPIRLVAESDIRRALDTVGPPLDRQQESRKLARDAECSQNARRFVSETLTNWGLIEVRANALFVTTELVENAFLHSSGHDDIGLQLETYDALLTVAVADSDPREAKLRQPGPGGTRFYGLHLVARLASAWGCAPQWSGGKVVWASLPTA